MVMRALKWVVGVLALLGCCGGVLLAGAFGPDGITAKSGAIRSDPKTKGRP